MTVDTRPENDLPADDTDEDLPTETVDEEPLEQVAEPKTGRRWIVGAAICCCVLAIVTVVQLISWGSASALAADTSRASRVGQTAVVTLLSYDYRTMDADMAKARAQLTSSFAAEYDRVTASTVAPAAISQQVVTSAAVTGTAVVSRSKNTVVLLMFINQSSTSKPAAADSKDAKDSKDSKDAKPAAGATAGEPQRSIDLSRVRVTMQRTGISWRISDLRGV